MAVTFVNTTQSNAYPSGCAVDDLVIISCWSDAGDYSVPAGWTEIEAVLTSGVYRHRFFYRVRQSGDTFPGGLPTVLTNVSAYRGMDTTTPFRASQLQSGTTTSSTLSLTSVTAGADGDAAVYGAAGLGTSTHTQPTNYTQRFAPASSDTSGGDRLNLTSSQATSGSITRDSGVTAHWYHGILAVASAAAVGPGQIWPTIRTYA